MMRREFIAGRGGVAARGSASHDDEDIRRTFDELSYAPNDGVVVLPSPFNNVHRALIISLAARHHLPATYPFRYYAVDGSLMSYSVFV